MRAGEPGRAEERDPERSGPASASPVPPVAQDRMDPLQGIEMALRIEVAAERAHAQVRGAGGLARVEDAEPLRFGAAMDAEAALGADAPRIAPGGARVVVDPGTETGELRRIAQCEPAVGVLSDAPQHGLAGNRCTPDPHGDRTLDRQWIDPDVLHRVELALEEHVSLRPELLQELHLLRAAPAAGREVLAQGPVLAAADPHTDAQPQPTAAQDVDLGDLLRDEHRRTRRKDQNGGHQLDRARARRQVREQGERLVKMARVLARDLLRDPQVREAELLGQRCELANRPEVVLELSNRERDADLHARAPPSGSDRRRRSARRSCPRAACQSPRRTRVPRSWPCQPSAPPRGRRPCWPLHEDRPAGLVRSGLLVVLAHDPSLPREGGR